MRTNGFDWLHAIGDVNGRVLLTHMGKYKARIAADQILGKDVRVRETAHGPLSPRVVFSDPQVAAVGHTFESAEQAGLRVRAVDQPTCRRQLLRPQRHRYAGNARLVIDEDRRVLVGATFTGAEVAEFIHAATIAIVAQVVDELWHAVPSFPTRSEVWLRLLETYVTSEVSDGGRGAPARPRPAPLARTR